MARISKGARRRAAHVARDPGSRHPFKRLKKWQDDIQAAEAAAGSNTTLLHSLLMAIGPFVPTTPRVRFIRSNFLGKPGKKYAEQNYNPRSQESMRRAAQIHRAGVVV